MSKKPVQPFRFMLPPDLTLEQVAREIHSIRSEPALVALPAATNSLDLVHRVFIWQRLADLGFISIAKSVISAPRAALCEGIEPSLRHLSDRTMPRTEALIFLRSLSEHIAGTARFPWLERLSYSGDILETAINLIEPTDVLFQHKADGLADPFSIDELRSFLQERLGEPRWTEMFSLMPAVHLNQHAAPSIEFFNRTRISQPFTAQFVPASPRSQARAASTYPFQLPRTSCRDPISVQMLPLFISIDEDAFQHVFSPAAFTNAPADDAIYLISKPTPGDNVLTALPEYSRLADIDRYDGRHRFALASISMDAIHSSAHEAGSGIEGEGFVVEIERKITIFRKHIVYEMRLNDASPRKKLHKVSRLMRFIRFLSAMAFTDIALIKARSEEQDKSPVIYLEIDSTSATTDLIGFGIRYASHGFRERFLRLGCSRSVKLALPALEPFDETNSELFDRVRLRTSP